MKPPAPTIIKTYRSGIRYLAIVPIAVALLFFAQALVTFIFIAQIPMRDFLDALILQILAGTLFSGIAFFVLNAAPVISTTEFGLYVSYNFGRLFLPWESITRVVEYESGSHRSALIHADALPWVYSLNTSKPLGTKGAFLATSVLGNQDIDEMLYLINANRNREQALEDFR